MGGAHPARPLSTAARLLHVGFGVVIALVGVSSWTALQQGQPPPLRHALHPGQYGDRALRNLSSFRSSVLESLVADFPRDHKSEEHLKLARFDRFPSALSCPPGQPLQRYGNEGEGGKLLCHLGALTAPCVVYSMGSRGDYSFEEDVLRSTPCEVHTFDCTFDGRSVSARHSYHKLCVGTAPERSDFRTYDEVLHMLDHSRVDLLKIDIEGHEVRVFGGLKETSRALPRQLVAELHFRTQEEGAGMAVTTVRTLPQMGLIYLHLANLGYGPVAREDNANAGLGCCAEITFLRVEAQR